MNGDQHRLDFGRQERIGLPEAIFCLGKSASQIASILDTASERAASLLLTRLDCAGR